FQVANVYDFQRERNMKRASVASGMLVLMTGFALVGCGDEADRVEAPAEGPVAATDTRVSGTIPEPMQAFEDDGDVAAIVIEGDDLIRYDIDRFEVRPGQMVRITLNHVGSLPAQAMGHNVVILQAGEVYYDFGADVGEHGGS